MLKPAQCFSKPEAHSCAGETRMTPLESGQNRIELKPKNDRTRFTIKPRIDPGSTHDLWGTNGDTPGDPAVEPSEGPPEGPPTDLQSVPRGATNKNKHGTTITKKPRNGNHTRFPPKNPPEPSTCILLRTMAPAVTTSSVRLASPPVLCKTRVRRQLSNNSQKRCG